MLETSSTCCEGIAVELRGGGGSRRRGPKDEAMVKVIVIDETWRADLCDGMPCCVEKCTRCYIKPFGTTR
jgi:hypothetical protein